MAKNGSHAPYQPTDSGGLFGFLQRLFVATPTYRGDGQPPSQRGGLLGGLFGGGTPTYRQAPPAPEPADEPAEDVAASATRQTASCNGQSGPLTIVIAPD